MVGGMRIATVSGLVIAGSLEQSCQLNTSVLPQHHMGLLTSASPSEQSTHFGKRIIPTRAHHCDECASAGTGSVSVALFSSVLGHVHVPLSYFTHYIVGVILFLLLRFITSPACQMVCQNAFVSETSNASETFTQ